LFWEKASGLFDVECYVVTVSPVIDKMAMTSTILTDNICNMATNVSSDIITTKSTTLVVSISAGVNYSVLVRTVSKCGQLSNPAKLQEDNEFVSIGKHCIMGL